MSSMTAIGDEPALLGNEPDATPTAPDAPDGLDAGQVTAFAIALASGRYLPPASGQAVTVTVSAGNAFRVTSAGFALADRAGATVGAFAQSVRVDGAASALQHSLTCLLDAAALGGHYRLTVNAVCDDDSGLPQNVVLGKLLTAGD